MQPPASITQITSCTLRDSASAWTVNPQGDIDTIDRAIAPPRYKLIGKICVDSGITFRS